MWTDWNRLNFFFFSHVTCNLTIVVLHTFGVQRTKGVINMEISFRVHWIFLCLFSLVDLVVSANAKRHGPYLHRTWRPVAGRTFRPVSVSRRTMLWCFHKVICKDFNWFNHKVWCECIYTKPPDYPPEAPRHLFIAVRDLCYCRIELKEVWNFSLPMRQV